MNLSDRNQSFSSSTVFLSCAHGRAMRGLLPAISLLLGACIEIGPGIDSASSDGTDDDGASTGMVDDGTSTSTSTGMVDDGMSTGMPADESSSGDEPGACDVPAANAGVTVGMPDGIAVEGAEAVAYSVVLDAEPCAEVTITLEADGQVEAPASITFTPQDWDSAQLVLVSAVHDFEREGDHSGAIMHSAASADAGYDGVAIDDAIIDIADRSHLAHVSVPLVGPGADGSSSNPRVSADGRWVAFNSSASNLVVGDSGIFSDVLRRDMDSGVNERITTGVDGEPNAGMGVMDMSGDGSVIAFSSAATNLVAQPTTAPTEVFHWNAADGIALATTTCAGCSQSVRNWVSLSSDGAYLAYSTRRQLLPTDPETEFDVYTLSLSDGVLTHDSLNSADGNGTAFWGSNALIPRLSSDGSFVGFHSPAGNLDTPEILVQNFHPYVKDRASRALTRVSRHDGGDANCEGSYHATGTSAPFVSTNGNIAVFASACAFDLAAPALADSGAFVDVFVRDIAAMTTTRISVGHDGSEADGDSVIIDVSDDARYVLFRSFATNLVPDDTNDTFDLFVHDRMAATTTRVTYDMAYGELASSTDSASLSPTGDWVVWTTVEDLADTDVNGMLDVYRVQLR